MQGIRVLIILTFVSWCVYPILWILGSEGLHTLSLELEVIDLDCLFGDSSLPLIPLMPILNDPRWGWCAWLMSLLRLALDFISSLLSSIQSLASKQRVRFHSILGC